MHNFVHHILCFSFSSHGKKKFFSKAGLKDIINGRASPQHAVLMTSVTECFQRVFGLELVETVPDGMKSCLINCTCPAQTAKSGIYLLRCARLPPVQQRGQQEKLSTMSAPVRGLLSAVCALVIVSPDQSLDAKLLWELLDKRFSVQRDSVPEQMGLQISALVEGIFVDQE